MKDDRILFPSAILGREIPLRILLPEGENLPCLVLLHGYGGTENQWCDRSIIRTLAQQHSIAVVMPGCGDGYYEDTNENIPAFLGEELVPYLKTVLPISGRTEDCFLAGVSMGGFGALLIGAKYPQTFGKIAALSGAFIIPDVVIGNPGVLGNANPWYFKKVFGSFEDLEGSSRDPLAEAVRSAKAGKLPPVYLMCGNRDVLCRENRKIAKTLADLGVDLFWQEAEGGHTWDVWNAYLPQMFQWLNLSLLSWIQ